MSRGRLAAVRWVLSLIDQRDGQRAVGDAADCQVIDWAHTIAFASAHMILPALAPRLGRAGAGMPEEVVAFLSQMHAANRARNAALRMALAEIGAALGTLGAAPLVLKGGAFLLDGDESEGARFMSDLDILVGERDLDVAAGRLTALGYTMIEAPYNPAREAHAPPLASPCGTFTVELHTRLFAGADCGLSVARVRASSIAADFGLRVPCADVRLAHGIVHAQMHNRQAVGERLMLRDVLDVARFAGRAVIDQERLDGLFPERRTRWAAGGLVAAAERLAGLTGFRATASEQAWADRAIARLEWPAWRRLMALPGDCIRLEGHRLAHERGHLARRLAMLGQPTRLGHAARAWAYKQRQRLWA